VEAACEAKPRGSFDRLRSLGCNEPIRFEIYYREAKGERPIAYELEIGLDPEGRPFVQSEILRQRRRNQKYGRPYLFLNLSRGEGDVWAGEGLGADRAQDEEETAKSRVELTDPRQLGIATLGTLKEHPRIKRFRDFLKGWYLSYFYPDAARELTNSGAQKRLSIHGDNIGNVVQYLEREHKTRFETILRRIASKTGN
jgi:predicted ATPase